MKKPTDTLEYKILHLCSKAQDVMFSLLATRASRREKEPKEENGLKGFKLLVINSWIF